MPTGYTSAVADGRVTKFDQFALRCARAFGALIELRDESLDATIPAEMKPSTYHQEALATARQQLKVVQKWDDAQAEVEAQKSFDVALQSAVDYGKKQEETGRAYVAMARKTNKWTAPGKDHEPLKQFMLDQLLASIEHDCLYATTIPVRLSGAQFKAKRLEQLKHNVDYHRKEWAAEVKRVAGRNKWLSALRDSLKDQH